MHVTPDGKANILRYQARQHAYHNIAPQAYPAIPNKYHNIDQEDGARALYNNQNCSRRFAWVLQEAQLACCARRGNAHSVHNTHSGLHKTTLPRFTLGQFRYMTIHHTCIKIQQLIYCRNEASKLKCDSFKPKMCTKTTEVVVSSGRGAKSTKRLPAKGSHKRQLADQSQTCISNPQTPREFQPETWQAHAWWKSLHHQCGC